MNSNYDEQDNLVIKLLQEDVIRIFNLYEEPWEDAALPHLLGVLQYYMYVDDYVDYYNSLVDTYRNLNMVYKYV